MKKLYQMKYGYLWITLSFFLISIIGHWIFAWYAYINEALEHGSDPSFSEYLIEVLRDTLENWQSEFLQLMWQVAGLSYLLYIGSPQSKEGDERKDELLEHIVRTVDPDNGDEIVKKLEKKYPKK